MNINAILNHLGNKIINVGTGSAITDGVNMGNLTPYAPLAGSAFTGAVTLASTLVVTGATSYGGVIVSGVTSTEYGTGEVNRQITASAAGAGNNFSTWYRASTKMGVYGYSDTTTDILYLTNALGTVSINSAIFSLTGGLSTTTGTFSGALIASLATIGGTYSGLAGLQINAQVGASGGYATAQFGPTSSLFIQQPTGYNEIASNNYINGSARTSLSTGYSHVIQFNISTGTLVFGNSLSSLAGGTSNPINSSSLTLDKSGNAAFLGAITVGNQSQSSLAGLTVLKQIGATGGYTITQFGTAIPLFLQQSGTATINEISSNSYISGTTRTVITAGFASLMAMSTVDGSFTFYSTAATNAAASSPSFAQLAKIDNTGTLTLASGISAATGTYSGALTVTGTSTLTGGINMGYAGSSAVQNGIYIQRQGAPFRNYAPISICYPNDSNNYSYLALVRVGNIAYNLGVDTAGRFFIGAGGTSFNTAATTSENVASTNLFNISSIGTLQVAAGMTVGSITAVAIAGLSTLYQIGATSGYTTAQFGPTIPLFLQQSGTATVNEISSNSYLSGTTRTVVTAGFANMLSMSTVDGSFTFYSTATSQASAANPTFTQLAKLDKSGNMTLLAGITATTATFSGVVTLPTISGVGTNSNQAATTSFVWSVATPSLNIITASYSLLVTDTFILVNNGATAITITLYNPDNFNGYRPVTLTRMAGSTGTVTIVIAPGGGSIQGLTGAMATTQTLSALGSAGASITYSTEYVNYYITSIR